VEVGWAEVVALLSGVGYGLVSGIIPLINAEAFVVASQLTAAASAVPTAIGIAIGQTIGKVALFYAVRGGRQLPFVKARREEQRARPASPARLRWRRFVDQLLQLVGDPRWGLPITLLAAFLGIPPLYAVALIAGATRMNGGWFAATVLVGRLLRFVFLALGIGWSVQLWT
jgi:membrane protein YqaA with SNARE-associated domain